MNMKKKKNYKVPICKLYNPELTKNEEIHKTYKKKINL